MRHCMTVAAPLGEGSVVWQRQCRWIEVALYDSDNAIKWRRHCMTTTTLLGRGGAALLTVPLVGVSMGTVRVGWRYFHYHTHVKLLLPIP
jgi:hypothetical protein